MYIQYGANFIVSPFLDEETAVLCNKRKVAYSPGCGSVTEIHRAEALGVEICKIFPGSQVGGPGFVKSVLGPCPRTNLMPTGGVEPTEESLTAWFGAGVACVGLGSSLVPSSLNDDFDFASITAKLQKAREILSGLKRKRG
jgi:2-dehydro-3-deoxyphosphogluconate aldolase/(4S)-4-hydroxy-2-oxoglutarate aldolase